MRLGSRMRGFLLVALAAACGDDPFTVTDPEFSYTVSRDNGDELTIEGAGASWGVTEFQTPAGFQSRLRIQLSADVGAGDNPLSTPTLFIDSQNDDLARDEPEPGTYEVVPTGEQFMAVTIGTSSGSYVADGGSVVISESSSSGLRGTLDLHFRPFDPVEVPNFDLVGEFSARNFSELPAIR